MGSELRDLTNRITRIEGRITWLEGENFRLKTENTTQGKRITWLEGENFRLKTENTRQGERITWLEGENTIIRGEELRMKACCGWLQEQNAKRFSEHAILAQDGLVWCRWNISNVTSSILLRLKPGNDRSFESHTSFQNALNPGNATTANFRVLLKFMSVDTPYQLQFAINSDLVIDSRNQQAHHYRGVGLRQAVWDAQGMFARHKNLIDDPLFRFCKHVLDYYPYFPSDPVLCRLYPD